MIEYILFNVLILELKIYRGPNKFYGRSKFGQCDEIKNCVPLYLPCIFAIPSSRQSYLTGRPPLVINDFLFMNKSTVTIREQILRWFGKFSFLG